MARYDQCDDTCTTDCGHCKGQGRPIERRVTGTRHFVRTLPSTKGSIRHYAIVDEADVVIGQVSSHAKPWPGYHEGLDPFKPGDQIFEHLVDAVRYFNHKSQEA